MKKITMLVLGISLFASSALMAHSDMPTHTGNHMHEGKMANHSNPNGMTDEQMKKMNESKKKDMNMKGMDMSKMKSNHSS